MLNDYSGHPTPANVCALRTRLGLWELANIKAMKILPPTPAK